MRNKRTFSPFKPCPKCGTLNHNARKFCKNKNCKFQLREVKVKTKSVKAAATTIGDSAEAYAWILKVGGLNIDKVKKAIADLRASEHKFAIDEHKLIRAENILKQIAGK